MREQIGETRERLPAGGSTRQSPVEVENQGFPGPVAQGPKVSHRIAAQERLREVPYFTREPKLSGNRV